MEETRIKGIMTTEDIEQLINLKCDPKVRPETVTPSPRFAKSIAALHALFNCDEPPKVTIRTPDVNFIVNDFADASKSGFGALLEYANGVHYRVWTWLRNEYSCSSNLFREFVNIVEVIEEEVQKVKLKNQLLY